MSCKFEKLLVDFFHGELPAAERKQVQVHLKQCHRCRLLLSRVTELNEDTKSMPVPHLTQDEWSAIRNGEHRILSLFWRVALSGFSAAVLVFTVIVITKQLSSKNSDKNVQTTGAPLAMVENERPRISVEQGFPQEKSFQTAGKAEVPAILPLDLEHRAEQSVLTPHTEHAVPSETAVAGVDIAAGEVHIPVHQSLHRAGVVPAAPETKAGVSQPAAAGGDVKTSAVEVAGRFPGEPVLTLTYTPVPEQKDKVVIKHNRINPFLGEMMTVSMKSENRERVSIRIYDSLGQLVRVVADKQAPAGINEFYWDGKDDRGAVAASGIYLIVIETPGYRLEKKGVVVK